MIDLDVIIARKAIEALRAGVPNRAAIRILGSVETEIEERFLSGIGGVWKDNQPSGLLFGGGFGSGKSHLLNYLREKALAQNFIVSWVTISKETPLSQPGPVFASAMRNTMVPGRIDDAVTTVLAEVQSRQGAVQDLELWASTPESRLAPVFAAVTHILARNLPSDLVQGIESFLAGGKPPSAGVRLKLADLGAKGMFDLSGVKAAELQVQRPRFMAQLIHAAGFAGWCVLLDEVELIGRYGPVQRATAYAELARWLGQPVPGLHVTGAITDDFASEVIDVRCDDEKLPERLRNRGLPRQAELAVAAMDLIRKAPTLAAPRDADLLRHAAILRDCYTTAYSWPAPPATVAERRANRTMRHHVRGWITEWDMLRLEGSSTGLDVTTAATNYSENDDLTAPPEEDAPEG